MVSRMHRYPRLSDPTVDEERPPLRVMVIGTCNVTPLVSALRKAGQQADTLLWESYSFAALPEFAADEYDAVVAGITLRHIMLEASKLVYHDCDFGHDVLWGRIAAVGRLDAFLEACQAGVRDILDRLDEILSARPAFFLSFIEPMHNYLGNLLPRYRLANPVHFVRRLNAFLAGELEARGNRHLFDINELLSLVGRARVQDDYILHCSHASLLQANDGYDRDRLARSVEPMAMFDTVEALAELETVLAQRLLDDLRILAAPLAIKAIIVDLDDTLWRGVAADESRPHWEIVEGWPLGLAEALLFYKARGGMLAVCSKNDPAVAAQRINDIYGGKLALADFASVRINFGRKSDNIGEILDELNLLPANVLFIDDNPREIEEVRHAFPTMRFLNADHYDWRRKVLMSPETQVAAINADAGLRTQSVQANVARRQQRESMSTEDWLRSLELRQRISIVTDDAHPDFARAFELLNKTNQFNTTGRRWQHGEIVELLAGGGSMLCSFLADRLADNGMIGVTLIRDELILQAVLSCRAFQFGAEYVSGSLACAMILDAAPRVEALLADTGLNKTCHGYFRKMGFAEEDGRWRATQVPPMPDHIAVELPDGWRATAADRRRTALA